MYMKARLGAILILMLYICSMLVIPVNAAAGKTPLEKAEALNKLYILQGDGKDYNLDGQLRRSEAAAFIVRIMGMEKEVLENKQLYNETGFPDVEKTQWHAPYIGYCVKNGIIVGYPNGNYGPDDPISEKSFLKLVLGVLGLKYADDFDWSEVYVTAYNNGIVLNPAYEVKSEDNTDYKRKEVVNVLYNALKRPNRNTKVTVLDNLINKEIIDNSIAVSLGLKIDTIQTEISQVSVVDANKIIVKYNEEVQNVNSSDIRIYETQNPSSILSSTITSQTSDEIILSTAEQIPEKSYTLVISGIEDMEGNRKELSAEFTGYNNPEVISEFFKIKKIEAVSKNVIRVYFTQPISMNVEMPMYYELLQGDTALVKGSFQNMSIKTASTADNAVSIFFTNYSLLEGQNYTLKINGNLTGIYGLKLNDGDGDSMNFTAKGTENEGFFVVGVTPLYISASSNKSFIRVDFNKEVDIVSAQQWFTNYRIKDSNGIPSMVIGGSIVQDGEIKNCAVILTISGLLDSSKNYELTISNIQDKFKQITLPENGIYPFPGVTAAKEPLAIVNVAADDKGTLTVFFNRPISASTAGNTTFYNIAGMSNPIAAYFNIAEPYKVRLFFPSNSFIAPNTYTLRVTPGMADFMNDTITTTIESTFNGSSTDYIKPLLAEAVIVGKDAIRVRTSREISSSGLNTSATNYKLEYKDGNNNTISKMPVNVSWIDATTLILRFDSLDFNQLYTLKFSISLTDYSGTMSRTPSDGLDSVGVILGY